MTPTGDRREDLRREIASGLPVSNRPRMTLAEAEALFPGCRVVIDFGARCDARPAPDEAAVLLVSPDTYCEWREQALLRDMEIPA